jgi:hypothetical protein
MSKRRALIAAIAVLLGVGGAMLLRRGNSPGLPSSATMSRGDETAAGSAPTLAGAGDVPDLIRSGAPSGLQNRPGAADYDPRKLADLMGLAEVFHREPRAPQWAPIVESWLSERMTVDLQRMSPGLQPGRDVTIRCASTTCRLGWTNPELRQVLDAAVRALYSPVRISYGPRELYVAYYGGDFYRGVLPLDPQSLFAELNRLRARNLRAIRNKPSLRQANRWDRVPLESWPEN